MIDTFRVGLLLTERCNIECHHCWLNSGPSRRETMLPEEAKGYIDQALEIPSMEWVNLTGEEPFLVPETLSKLVSYVSGRGLNTKCITNCFWASTPKKVRRTLGAFADAGLTP